MNVIMNDSVSSDREYQAIIRKSDEYPGRLEKMELPKEIRLLIDRYISEQNALGFPCLYLPGKETPRYAKDMIPNSTDKLIPPAEL